MFYPEIAVPENTQPLKRSEREGLLESSVPVTTAA